jgi:hypothetical protein
MDFANASRLARDAIDLIELDAAVHLPLATRIINRNLDRAVARTLSFSGDRVEELMTRLRTYLKSQGQELVLLVEEFARLQGIDRALLQAITSQGDERQCKMRTAIAVTTGFFQSVAETPTCALPISSIWIGLPAGPRAGRSPRLRSASSPRVTSMPYGLVAKALPWPAPIRWPGVDLMHCRPKRDGWCCR